MSDLVDIVVYGSSGRMGQAVVRAILESDKARLSCALVRPGSGLADEPLDRVFGTLPRVVDFSTALDPDAPHTDARADGVNAFLARRDRHLGPEAGFARDGFDLDRAAEDLGDFLFEETAQHEAVRA